jgi:3D (Asp-Asp-Asp) domain-containing protein
MNKSVSQEGGANLLHHGWELVYDVFELVVLSIFVGISLFPAQALAFANDVEVTHRRGKVAGVIEVGSMEVRSTLAEGSRVKVLSMAYSSAAGQTDSSPDVTASGKKVGSGTIAANFLPFGTKVRIENEIYTVNDRMSSRYDGKYVIDIWKPSRPEAMQYGTRIVEVEIVRIP